MTMRERAGLDRHITGNYGEDQQKAVIAYCPDCYGALRENEDGWYCPKCAWTGDGDEDTQPPVWCADCGGECVFESVDKVWRCRVCDLPHEADGTAIRFGEEGQ